MIIALNQARSKATPVYIRTVDGESVKGSIDHIRVDGTAIPVVALRIDNPPRLRTIAIDHIVSVTAPLDETEITEADEDPGQ